MRGMAAVVGVVIVAGCGLTKTEHPLAVARVTPQTLCKGDDHATTIHLSAANSLAISQLPGVPAPEGRCLESLSWEITGTPYKIMNGALECALPCPTETVECAVDITVPGTDTATIILTATNDNGYTDFAKLRLGLTTGGPCE